MKTLHIIPLVYGGGAEKIVNDWVNADKSIEIDVLSMMPLPESKVDHPNYFSLNAKKPYSIMSIFNMYKYIKKYDVIHTHLFPAQICVAILSIVFPSKKFITTEHSTSNRRRSKKIFKYVDKIMYKRYSVIGCITLATKEALENHIGNKYPYVVIPNGVNVKKIRESTSYNKEYLGFDCEDMLIGMFSRFSEAKDHATLVRAMNLLPDNYKLLLVGDGELRKDIENMVNDLGIGDRVKFLGFRNDVYSIMKACDVVVQSSHWEGFGLVVVEAMACGRPVVVSNIPGMRGLVAVENRFTNEKELVDLILNKKYNTDYLDKSFDIGVMIRKYEQCYMAVLGVGK
ncbi:MAG: glycosyltransferase involved in cell wall biosynthesis [Francisella sp.]|jgi:glycosyltransferase involved in cell wall biosynthesis